MNAAILLLLLALAIGSVAHPRHHHNPSKSEAKRTFMMEVCTKLVQHLSRSKSLKPIVIPLNLSSSGSRKICEERAARARTKKASVNYEQAEVNITEPQVVLPEVKTMPLVQEEPGTVIYANLTVGTKRYYIEHELQEIQDNLFNKPLTLNHKGRLTYAHIVKLHNAIERDEFPSAEDPDQSLKIL